MKAKLAASNWIIELRLEWIWVQLKATAEELRIIKCSYWINDLNLLIDDSKRIQNLCGFTRMVWNVALKWILMNLNKLKAYARSECGWLICELWLTYCDEAKLATDPCLFSLG